MSRFAVVVFEKTGGNHEKTAQILSDLLDGWNGWRTERLAGSEMLGDPTIHLMVRAWNLTIRKDWIRLCDVVLNHWLRRYVFPLSEIQNTGRLLRRLEALRPDLIVSTADGYNKALGAYARRAKIPFLLCVTELSVFLDLVSPDAIHLCAFPQTAEAIRSYPSDLTYFSHRLEVDSTFLDKLRFVLGYTWDHAILRRPLFQDVKPSQVRRNDVRCEVLGPLRESWHYGERDRAECRATLGLPKDATVVLVASGSIGGQFLTKAVTALRDGLTGPAVILAACGRDPSTRQVLESLRKREGLDVRALGFVDRFDDLLGAADLLVARPSAGTFLEALLARVPVVLPRRATSNDRGAVTLTEMYGLGASFGAWKDLPWVVEQVLADRDACRQRIEAFMGPRRRYEEIRDAFRSLVTREAS